MRSALCLPLLLLLSLSARATFAQSAASAAPAPSGAPPALVSVPSVGGPCVEQLPEGKARPKLTQSVPARAISGHALTVKFQIEHGKGETVLPSGFQPQSSSKELEALERSGLYLPDPDGGAGPVLERTEKGEQATTSVSVSFVPLPSKPGRNEMIVPPLPVAIARASGEMMVLCTDPARVIVEDPIANTPDPKPRDNPAPRPQVEEWTAAKHATYVALVAVVAGALLAWLIGKWLRRPRPVPPAPPPRPAWELALEELFDLRHSGLLGEQRYGEYFDRVSDIVRKYLGARYGFDGLESTTREALALLRHVSPRIAELETIETCLKDADLVKFARVTPAEADCALALARAEQIVRATTPDTQPSLPASAAVAEGAPS